MSYRQTLRAADGTLVFFGLDGQLWKDSAAGQTTLASRTEAEKWIRDNVNPSKARTAWLKTCRQYSTLNTNELRNRAKDEAKAAKLHTR